MPDPQPETLTLADIRVRAPGLDVHVEVQSLDDVVIAELLIAKVRELVSRD